MNKILIVISTFYKEISSNLENEAIKYIEENNFEFDVIYVPGAFEIPAIIAKASKYNMVTNYYVGYIALGCVIRGETSHYDYVCNESTRALMDLSIDGIALGYGILTCENREQADVRANPKGLNKGRAAAVACIEMIKNFSKIQEKSSIIE